MACSDHVPGPRSARVGWPQSAARAGPGACFQVAPGGIYSEPTQLFDLHVAMPDFGGRDTQRGIQAKKTLFGG